MLQIVMCHWSWAFLQVFQLIYAHLKAWKGTPPVALSPWGRVEQIFHER